MIDHYERRNICKSCVGHYSIKIKSTLKQVLLSFLHDGDQKNECGEICGVGDFPRNRISKDASFIMCEIKQTCRMRKSVWRERMSFSFTCYAKHILEIAN
jgi:hypothetical protein